VTAPAPQLDAVFKPRECFNRHGEAKVPFVSKRDAKASARGLRYGDPQVYRCTYCLHFHIGNPVDTGDQAEADQ